jgi:hypothetical protein
MMAAAGTSASSRRYCGGSLRSVLGSHIGFQPIRGWHHRSRVQYNTVRQQPEHPRPVGQRSRSTSGEEKKGGGLTYNAPWSHIPLYFDRTS